MGTTSSTRSWIATAAALLLVGGAGCGTAEQPASATTAQAATAAAGVVDLGTLPGGTYASARAINAQGQIAGVSNDGTLTGNKQVIWSGGAITPISPCCGSGQATPRAINGAREVVAWENAGYRTAGVYWDPNGVVSVLPALPGGEGFTFAYDINGSGLIAGQSRVGTGLDRHAVLWSRTTLLRDLGLMGAASPGLANMSGARGVNEAGDVVGEAVIGMDYHAFFWRNGAFTDLGLGSAVDVNDAGLVAGNQSGMPWTWQGGARKYLPGLAGQAIGYGHTVTGLNNAGDVVGYAQASGAGLRNTAVLWRGGKALDLGFFPGGDVSMAFGINDAGQIVGEGNLTPGGPMHALLWSAGATGGSGGGGSATAPAVTLAATSTLSIRAGGRVSVAGRFTDPDSGPWTYKLSWGNGTTSGTASAPGTIAATRTYASRGQYQVTLTVTDSTGAVGRSAALQVRVR